MDQLSIAVAALTRFAIAFAILSVAHADEGTDGIRTELKANSLAIVLSGEGIYQTQCAACHGVNLEGQPNWRKRDSNGLLPAPPHDETGHTWHHDDDLLFEIVKYGTATVIGDDSYRSQMPVYQHILSDEEIVAVLSYIKHSWPEEQRLWQEEINGTQNEGFVPIQKNPTFFEKLRKLIFAN